MMNDIEEKIKAAGQLLCYTVQLVMATSMAIVLTSMALFFLFTWVVAIPYVIVAIICNLVSNLLV